MGWNMEDIIIQRVIREKIKKLKIIPFASFLDPNPLACCQIRQKILIRKEMAKNLPKTLQIKAKTFIKGIYNYLRTA